MTPEHVIGAVFLAYIVIKEVFYFVKGETKVISKRVERFYQWFFEEDRYEKIGTCFDTIGGIKADFSSLRENFCEMNKKIIQLWDWHNKEDDDGVKIWYVRKSLETGLYRLSDTLEKQNRLIMGLIKRLSDVEGDIENLKK